MADNFNPDDSELKNKAVHISGNAGGVLVGNRHSEGGIKAINKSTAQPLEMEGGEVVITRDAVSDTTKRNFNGEQLTNRQILSRINESGGGIQFAEDGAELPTEIYCSGNTFEYGGVALNDWDIVSGFFASGGEINLEEEGVTEEEFNREIMDAFHDISKVFNRFGYSLQYISDDKNYVNYRVVNRESGKQTNIHEIRKKELWEETPSDVFDKEYGWLTGRYEDLFSEASYENGGSLDAERSNLRLKANQLIKIKEEKFGDVDISEPMSQEEKDLTREIARVYSRLNQIVRENAN